MASVNFVAQTNASIVDESTSSPWDIIINRSTAVQAKDILLAGIQMQGNQDFDAAPAGWTQLANRLSNATTPSTVNSECRLGVWWKRAGSTESTSYTFSADGDLVYSACIAVYRDVSTSTAGVETSASTFSTATNDTTIACPSVDPNTTSTGYMAVFFAGCNPQTASTAAITFSWSTAVTERFDSSLTSDGTTLRASLSAGDRLLSSTGANPAAAATISNDGRNCGVSVLLRPTSGAAAPTTEAAWFFQSAVHGFAARHQGARMGFGNR